MLKLVHTCYISWDTCTVLILKYIHKMFKAVWKLGLCQLCQHNVLHNRYVEASSRVMEKIMA